MARISPSHWAIDHHLFLAALVVAVLAAASGTAVGQTVFSQDGIGPNHDSYTVLPYEHVDPASGNLLVIVTDLVLPGNAGLNLTIQRSYNSKIHTSFETGNYALEEDSWAGIGWRLHFGRVINPSSTTSGATQIEMSDGSRHPLYTTTAYPEGWITRDFWRYNRATNTLLLPNGLTYVFGQLAAANGALGAARYVTEIRDPFNNRITFSYFNGTNGPTDGVASIRQYTNAAQTQYRDVTFAVDPATKSVTSMTYDGRTWTYQQTASGANSLLTRVTPPAGLPWVYEYNSASTGAELSALVAPGGGRIDYGYSTVSRYAGALVQSSRVVSQRTISGYRITPGTWTFAYSQGTNKDTTIVTCACGTSTYRFLGTGTSGAVNAWLAGALAEQTVEESGNVLQRDTFTWQQSAAVSPDPIAGTSGVWGDPAVYNALPASHTVTRGPQSWVTTFQYNGTNFNDFGRPWRVVQTGERVRTTQTTFQYGFTPYIVDRTASQSVQVGAEIISSSWTYNLATGFLTAQTLTGFTTTFEATTEGNVFAVIDGNTNRTEFSYAWGVVSETRSPLVTVTNTIDPSGVVLAATTGNATTYITTRYEYDQALRLHVVRPPGEPTVANPIVYWYDNVGSQWVRIERGSSQVTHDLDGFGRVVEKTDVTQVKTTTTRDACGRPTFTSYPYSSPSPTRGVTTTYDALGRVKTVTTPDLPTSGVTQYSYSGIDVTVTDPQGRTRALDYSAAGGPGDELLARVTDPAGINTDYEYNVFDTLTKVTGPGAGLVRQWVYDAQNRLLSQTQPESGTTTYNLYDGVGNLKQFTNSKSEVTTMTYDANNRLKTRDALGTVDDLTITYDPVGRVSQLQTGAITTSYAFDAASRLASRTDVIGGLGTRVSSYGYDNQDNLTRITYPSGRVITYTYDATKEYRLTGVLNDGATFANTFSYHADRGYLSSYQTGSVVHSFTYDNLDRIQRLQSGVGASPAFDLTYVYTLAGNVSSITDTRPGMNQTFGYDNLDRLTSATGPWGQLSWTYDSRGNRLTQRLGATTTYSYNQTTQRLSGTSGAVSDTFTWNNLGQLENDSRGTYTYTPTGMLATATKAPNLSASYTYDAENFRVAQTVNNLTRYTVRGADNQVLSEWESGCGTYWTKDYVYAGGRVLGAVKATLSAPSIAFTAASSTVAEAAGTVNVAVRITTPGGTPLACAAAVSYQITDGTTVQGNDHTATSGTLVFTAGSPSGSTQNIPVPVVSDVNDEIDETLTLTLTNTSGGLAGALVAPSQHALTITDDDPPPQLIANSIDVNEAAGTASVTVSLSPASGKTVTVNYATAAGTAKAGLDFTSVSGALTFTPGMIAQTVVIPIINDASAEPTEQFTLNLTSPVNATFGNATATVRIFDDEPPRAPIDMSLPGAFLADLHTDPWVIDYVTVFNANAVAVTARLTWTRPNGSGITRDYSIPARSRYQFSLENEPGIGGGGDVSLAVQWFNASQPLTVEHENQWSYPSWLGSRSSEGLAASTTWYFAEGAASGYFEEFITVYNPASGPVDVTLTYLRSSGGPVTQQVHIEEGPGRAHVRVNDVLGTADHGTAISATGAVVVERTMFWANGDYREGASSPGAPATSTIWRFAEGSKGSFSTYVLIANPSATAATVQVAYLPQVGPDYAFTYTVPAQGRISVPTPAAVPNGSFGIQVWSSNGVPVIAERSMFYGANWEVGTSGVGTTLTATQWFFADGSVSTDTDTYYLLANDDVLYANVTMTFRRTDGGVVTYTVSVPPRARVSVDPRSVPGLAVPGWFAVEVTVTNGVAIVAERATYHLAFPGWVRGSVSLGRRP